MNTLLATGGALMALSSLAPAQTARLSILNAEAGGVDSRLFGHFLERAGWDGELGVEAALVPGTRKLQPSVAGALESLLVPVTRFPGGTAVDYSDWTDLIDHAPGRASTARPVRLSKDGRPMGHEFGLEEFFHWQRRLRAESILVVNFLDGLSGRKTLEEAARHAAGMLAYANASPSQPHPATEVDWAEIRRKNGSAEPHRVRYAQLGNEWFMRDFQEAAVQHVGSRDPASLEAWYRAAIIAYADAIHQVEPTIEIIIDGQIGLGIESSLLAHPDIRARVKHLAWHTYAPGPVGEETAGISRQELIWRYSGCLGQSDENGLNQGLPQSQQIELARSLGYQIVCTEWNYNFWFRKSATPEVRQAVEEAAPAATASFLHGMMRQGVSLATQSMLVGEAWNIAGLRLNATGEDAPRISPQLLTTQLYARHHGTKRLSATLTVEGQARLRTPVKLGWHQSTGPLAEWDCVVTRGPGTLFVHGVYRGAEAGTLEVDFSALPGVPASRSASFFSISTGESADITETSVSLAGGEVSHVLWATHTVGILEIPWSEGEGEP